MQYYFLIQKAMAMTPAPEGAPDSGGHAVVMIVSYAVLFGIFYFLLIRPQMKRNKETRDMQDAIAKGDSVVTTGGMFGVIHKIKDEVVTLEIAEGVRVKLQRSAISGKTSESGESGESEDK